MSLPVSFVENALRPDSVFILEGINIPLAHKLTLASGTNYRCLPKPLPPEKLAHDVLEASRRFCRGLRLMGEFGCRDFVARRLRASNPLFEPERPRRPILRFEEKFNALIHNNLSKINPQYPRYMSLMSLDKNVQNVKTLRLYLEKNGYVVAKADKNLGMCVLRKDTYAALLQTYMESSSFRHVTRSHAEALLRRAYGQITRAAKAGFPVNSSTGKRDPIYHYVEQRTPVPADAKPVSPYLLLKVHKLSEADWRAGKTPPPRLLAPCHNTLCEAVARLIDQEVYPIYKRACCWNLSDSTTLIRELPQTHFPSNISIGKADVISMYPNIDLTRGLGNFRRFCEEYNVAHGDVYVEFMYISMHHHVSRVGEQYFVQIKGTAMGVPCACIFANVHAYMTERDVVQTSIASGCLLFYRRLIDDILAIFPSQEDGQAFFWRWNQASADIQLDMPEFSNQSMSFLDVRLTWRREAWTFSLHQKARNRYAYIPFSSQHPASSKAAWINAELQRYVRLNSTFDGYLHSRQQFIHRIVARGYPEAMIKTACRRVRYSQRDAYLTPSRRRQGIRYKKAILAVPFIPQVRALNLGKSIRTHWEWLSQTLARRNADWLEVQPTVAYTKLSNLYSYLRRLLPV